MQRCPKCHAEYREGFTTCADCGVRLVDESEDSESQMSSKDKKKANASNAQADSEQLLANTNDIVELSYITSMLQDAGIPYRIIGEDISDYLMIIQGSSFMGKNIYVSSSDYEQALNILDSYSTPTGSEDKMNNEDDDLGES